MAIIPVVLNTDLLQFPEMFQAFMNEDNISWLGKDLRMKLKKTFHNSDLIFCIDEYDERLVAIKYQPTEKPLYIFSSIKVKSFISISSKLSDEHKNQIANLNKLESNKIHYIGVEVYFWKLKKQHTENVATSFSPVA